MNWADLPIKFQIDTSDSSRYISEVLPGGYKVILRATAPNIYDLWVTCCGKPCPLSRWDQKYDSDLSESEVVAFIYRFNNVINSAAHNKQIGGDHYTGMVIQPVEYIHKNKIGFCEGCVIKYVSRWRGKGGIEDLEKAKHFIDLLIEMEKDHR